MKKFRAFTLAEVLITLGIIGVVAAMTMPTLIKDYQKKTWTTQLQKTYSILEQGFQKMMADDGVDKLSDTTVWASKGTTECYNLHGSSAFSTVTDCKNYFENFKKYFKVIGYEKYGIDEKLLNGPNRDPIMKNSYTVILSDGAMIMFDVNGSPRTKTSTVCNTIKSLGGNMCSEAGYMYIDVNGRKGPNTFGRDIFYFILSDEGKLYPQGGKDWALYNYQTALDSNWVYWRNSNTRCGNLDGSLPAQLQGAGCAGRIIENGWKMDY